MAFNKARTSTVTKVGIIVIGVVLIIGLAGPSMYALFSSLGDGGDSTGGEGVLETIALEYQQTTDTYLRLLESEPDSATLLAAAGDAHFEWAAAVQAVTSEEGPVFVGADRPLWIASAAYYERAVEAGDTSSEVRTDMAVAYFYGAWVDKAIEVIEGVLADDPAFGPALYNAGIFYGKSGRNAEAIARFEGYLAADPQDEFGNRDRTLQFLEDLGAGSAAETTPGP